MNASNAGSQLFLAETKILDPGASGTITVDKSLAIVELVSATAESRTLDRPTRRGAIVTLMMYTDAGDITLTVTGGYDENGTTTFTFSDPGQWITFQSLYDGTNYYWRKISDYNMANQTAAQGSFAATGAEIDAVADVSTRIVNAGASATTLAVTATQHAGRTVVVNSTVPIAITLPQATGTGNEYKFLISVVATATGHTIKVANATDIMAGVNIIAHTATGEVNGFLTTATDDTITLNGTTKGGLVGDKVVIIDMATGVFQVLVQGGASGTVVTPFSASVGS